MVNTGQGDLPDSGDVLRAIADAGDLLFGVYARVAVPGRVRVGDDVALS
jgi:MOSC domain-containing protein